MKNNRLFSRLARRQGGAVLINILIFIALSAVILAPVLNYIGTGIVVGEFYQDRADQYYAADAGVVDGLWQISNDNLNSVLTVNDGGDAAAYGRYDYDTNWKYQVKTDALDPSSAVALLNDYNVDVIIGNEWIPYGLAMPSAANAQIAIEGQGGNPPKMIVTGQVVGTEDDGDANPATTRYVLQIGLSYFPDAGDDIELSNMGVWLPSGFTYVGASNNLQDGSGSAYVPTGPTSHPWKGSTALIWAFPSTPGFGQLKGVISSHVPMVCKITIEVDGPSNRSLEAVSWVQVDNDSTDLGGGLKYVWDADTNVYRINSTANGTTTQIDAYAIQSKIRELSSSVNGDYLAIGNSLMRNTSGTDVIRETLDAESSATASGIPSDATVEAAYLYWSGWVSEDDSGVQTRVPESDGYSTGTWTVGDANTDWLSPTANSSTSGGDNNGFESNPQYAYSNDSNRAYNSNGAADRHLYYGYNISSVPSGTTILGIEVRLDWYLDSTTSTNSMSVELSWDGGTSWTASKTEYTERTSDGNPTGTLGGPADKWGHTWTTAELSNLRVRITSNSTSTSRGFYLDWVPVRITYPGPGGSLASRVDETVPNDADSITGVSDGYCLFDFANFNIPLGSKVDTLTVFARVADLTSGTNNIRGSIRIGSTNYNAASSDPGSSFDTLAFEWSENPATGNAWTVSEINALSQFGVYSNDLSPDVRVSMIYAQVSWRPDISVIFEIDGVQSYFDTDGVTPLQGSGQIVANPSNGVDRIQIKTTPEKSGDDIFYSVKKDVTALVKAFSADADLGPGVNRPGNGTYTVGGVDATTMDEYSYAGWSLIIIYSSPLTKGHQLYLFDTMFTSVDYSNQDFDYDGSPGGLISGFIVPEPVAGETEAARLTVFVGEGDAHYSGDELHFEGDALSDGTGGGSTNVWNGQSTTLAAAGVDIDTFSIAWADNLLIPGQSSTQIDLYTDEDTWELIYMIISFRSSVTSGGAITYLIH